MDFKIKTYSEIVINVSQLSYWRNLFEDYFKWNLVEVSENNPELLDFWGIKNAEKVTECLLNFQNLPYGKIRFCEVQGLPHKVMRSGGQTWDVGGILDIDLRVSNIQQAYQDLEIRGWQGFTPIAEAVMGPFTVEEVLMKGPDGVVIALVHRKDPPHPNPFGLDGCTSNVYLSAMIVKDLKMASDFFVKKLGFLLHNEIDFKSPKAERTMFGLPHHLADQTNVKLQIIGPEDNRDGLMDLIELEGIVGENFSANILPANKGILCYRFPVENLANYRKHLILNEVEIHSTFSGLTLVGIGKVNIFSVISPDGVRLEFYENVDST